MNPYATIRPEKVSGRAITNDSSVRRPVGSRDKCNATATPTAVDSVAATAVSVRLPASDGQNVGNANARPNAAKCSANASSATAASGSTKNTASNTTAGAASESSCAGASAVSAIASM